MVSASWVLSKGLMNVRSCLVIPTSSIFLLVTITAFTILVATNLLLLKDRYFIRLGYSFIVRMERLKVSSGKVRNLTIFLRHSSSKSA